MRATDVPRHHPVSPGGGITPGPCHRGGQARGRRPQWEVGCQPLLLMGKQGPRDGERLGQGHTAGEQQTRDASPEPHPVFPRHSLAQEPLSSTDPDFCRPCRPRRPPPPHELQVSEPVAVRRPKRPGAACAQLPAHRGGAGCPEDVCFQGRFPAAHGKPQRRPRGLCGAASVTTGRRGHPPGAGGAGPRARPPPSHAPVPFPPSGTQGARP